MGAFLQDGLRDKDAPSLELLLPHYVLAYKLPTWCKLFVQEKFPPEKEVSAQCEDKVRLFLTSSLQKTKVGSREG